VQTAYLKTHYTLEFMTALLSASKNDIEKIAWYIADARMMGIDVLPPNVNFGGWDFTVEECEDCKSAIRFGLGAVKNVGQNPVEMILNARGEKPFKDLNDFSRRVDLSRVGKRSLESMIKVGALDSFGPRGALLEAMDTILSVSSSHFSALNSGQLSFFGSIAGVEETINLPKANGVDKAQMLEWERELMGLYVSDHPLTPYLPILKRRVSHYSGQLGEVDKKDKVTVAGMVKAIRNHFTKDGKPMAFVSLEDAQGAIECILFPRAYTQYIPQVEVGGVLCAEGKVDAEGKVPKILVDQLSRITLDDIVEGAAVPAGSETGPSHDNPAANEPDNFSEEMEQDDDLPPPPEVVDWYMLEQPAPARQVKEPAQVDAISAAPPDGALASVPEVPAAPAADASPAPGSALPAAAGTSTFEAAKTPHTPKISAPETLPPLIENPSRSNGARMLTVTIHPTGDRTRDNRRLTQVHNLLCSSSGADRFCFIVFEGGHRYLLDFPNETTGINQDLLSHLGNMVGQENISVEKLVKK
jgi:DNA polymerase-3 subunit alpha